MARSSSNQEIEQRLLYQEFEKYCDANSTWVAVEESYWIYNRRQQEKIAEEDRKNGSVTSVHLMQPSEVFADPCIIRYAAERMVVWKNADGLAEQEMMDRPTLIDFAAERRLQCVFLRDIFNPFYPSVLTPNLLSSTVVTLAQGIYQDRAFDRLPILADALQDAGCDSDEILKHCRQPGEHVKGCWVIDLIMSKS